VAAIEVAEICPEVLAMARRWFAEVNHGVLDDPRVKVRIVDARSHMAVSNRTYDLIMSDSIHPRFRGNAALYTRDYFALCARRLRPGGFVSSWLPLYGLSVDDLRSVLASLRVVFPHVQVWYPNLELNENIILIGSQSPIVIDPPRIAARMADPAIASDLGEVGISGVYSVLDFFLAGDRGVATFARSGWLNTDDHPRLEFLAPRAIHRHLAWLANFEALRVVREPVGPLVDGAAPEVRATLGRWYVATGFKLTAQSDELQGRFGDAIRDDEECARLNPDDREVVQRLNFLRRVSAVTPGPEGGR
jgi:spermidine synthase